MKKCQKCGFENGDLMNFCMECGTVLENNNFSEQQTASYSNQPTASFPGVTPTNPSSNEARTVVSNQSSTPPSTPTIVQSPFTPPTPFTTAPQMPPPTPPKKGGSKMFLIVGGLLALLVLGGIGIVAIGAIAYISQNDPKPTPTPFKPTPNNSPVTTPTKVPLKPTPTDSQDDNNSTSEPDVDYKNMSVDFNVREGGKLGMKIHTSFTAKNMKNVDSYLAVYVQKNDGSPVNGNDSSFRSKTGQTAVFKLLRPAYDPAEYEDTQLFLPYSSFGLPRGKYNLQLEVYLIYKDETLQAKGPIAHLNTYDFEFEQK
ncbi:MAG: zinc ribbon domain-containing protein [Pyrinomonadaceae bacterium]|nr:zinc ribbon domain-containing protein [Pyrinomonadaceae bacterium]